MIDEIPQFVTEGIEDIFNAAPKTHKTVRITLKTLSEATDQEVFNQIAVHLLTQGQKCGIQSGADNTKFVCYYSCNGMACAAGCLIAAAEYDEDFEELAWGTLVADGHVPSEHEDLIAKLQEVHDSHAPENWYDSLHNLAFDFKLSPAVLAPYKPKA